MKACLLAIAIERETDIVLVRQRTRKIAGLVGFDTQDQTRITTALSEIARNALDYGEREGARDAPVIVVSSAHEEGKAKSLGADEYLPKPVDVALLVRTLDAVTGRRSITKVLVVDDEEVSRYLVRQLLPRGAFDLSEAATGEDGLRRALSEDFDVVLLDLNMPTMTGFDFLEQLAARAEADRVPAIVLTSARLTDDQRRRLGKASQIISKSDLASDMLMAAIHSAMTRGAALPPP